MNRAKYQSARVFWRMGQSLLPEHFYAQEEGLREEVFVRSRLSRAPVWGIVHLKWDALQLQQGVISIEEMTLILPTGQLVDVPGNTTPASFNLNATGSSKSPVFIHLQTGHEIATMGSPGDPEDDSVERVVQKIVLSSAPFSSTAAQAFKLAEFEKTADDVWKLSPSFIPTLARVGRTPFFDSTQRRIRSVNTALHQLLVSEIEQSYLAGESLVGLKECLKDLYKFMAMLAKAGDEVQYHPFDIFEALNNLYISVSVLRGTPPTNLERKYKHEHLGPCFEEILHDLEDQVGRSPTETLYAPFDVREGYRICKLPRAARAAHRVYWLVQKLRVGDQLDLTGLKLASESRLPIVHQRALTGVPFKRVENPPFHHNFSSEVEFYAVSGGEEWDHAVREGSIAFYHRPDLENVRTFMYWRDD